MQVPAIIRKGPKDEDASKKLSRTETYFGFRKSWGSIPVSLSMARRVPAGIAGVVRYGSIAVGFLVIPDLMASGGLPVKGKAEGLEPSYNLSISKPRQPSHFMH